MDQDKVLEKGRKALARVRANRVGRSAYELADAFEALDALMSNGEEAPTAWRRPATTR